MSQLTYDGKLPAVCNDQVQQNILIRRSYLGYDDYHFDDSLPNVVYDGYLFNTKIRVSVEANSNSKCKFTKAFRKSIL